MDHYVTQFGMLLIGIFEAILFLYYSKKLLRFIEDKNDWKFISISFIRFSWVISLLVLIVLIGLNFHSGILVYDSYSSAALLGIGLLPIGIVLALSFILNILENKKKSS